MTSEIQLKNRWYDQAIRIAIYGIVIIIPLIFSPSFQSVFSMPKLIVLHTLALFILLLWGYKTLQEEKFSYHKSPLNFCLIIYAAISILTTLFSINIFTSLWGTYGQFIGLWTTFDFLFLTFCAANFFRTKEEILPLLFASISAANVVSIYSLLEYFGVFKEIFHWNLDPTQRLFGMIGQSNHLGAYVGMNILLGLSLFYFFQKKSIQIVLAASVLLQCAIIVLTGSRGAVIALIISIFFVLYLRLKQQAPHKQKSSPKKIIFSLGILGLILISFILLWPKLQRTALVQRTMQTFQFWQEGEIPDRLSWWQSSLAMIKDRPLLGFGLATFSDAYNNYRRTDYKVPGPGNRQDFTTPESAHNEYLNMAATQGLLGLAAFLAIIIVAIRSLIQNFFSPYSHDTQKIFSLSILGAMVFFLLQLLVNFGVVSTWPLFFILLGLSESMHTKESLSIREYKGLSKYFFSILILLLTSIALVGIWHQAIADFFLKEAYRAQAQKQPQKVVENCQAATINHPQEYAYFQSCGDLALPLSIKSASATTLLLWAQDLYQKAAALNTYHPSTFFNLGTTQLQLFQITHQPELWQKAWINLSKAIDLAVNNPLYSYQTAQLYLKLGTPDAKEKAKQALQKTISIQPDYEDAQKLLKQLQ